MIDVQGHIVQLRETATGNKVLGEAGMTPDEFASVRQLISEQNVSAAKRPRGRGLVIGDLEFRTSPSTKQLSIGHRDGTKEKVAMLIEEAIQLFHAWGRP
jgi:hypothetical protein